LPQEEKNNRQMSRGPEQILTAPSAYCRGKVTHEPESFSDAGSAGKSNGLT
jgi:hypothetical protein